MKERKKKNEEEIMEKGDTNRPTRQAQWTIMAATSIAAIAVALSAHERQSINHIMFAFKIRIIMFPPI